MSQKIVTKKIVIKNVSKFIFTERILKENFLWCFCCHYNAPNEQLIHLCLKLMPVTGTNPGNYSLPKYNCVDKFTSVFEPNGILFGFRHSKCLKLMPAKETHTGNHSLPKMFT